MTTKVSKEEIYNEKRICRNLEKWAEVTALCIELRKSVLREKFGLDDDDELTRMVFAEAVERKGKQWELMKEKESRSSQSS